MFSLLGDGDLFCEDWTAAGVKNGEFPENVLNAGDNTGGLFEGLEAPSERIHGPEERFSETAESTGDAAPDNTLSRSCWPSA